MILWLHAIGITMLSSCEIINPEEDIPGYIQIDEIALTTDYSTEGTSSHKIVDAWVFIDDQLIGAYELPAIFPVLKEGSHHVKIKAGIKKSGISSTRIEYPFFENYEQNAVLVSQSIIKLSPVVKYYPQTVFKWIEDFEIGATIEKAGNSDTTLNIISADTSVSYTGNKIASVFLDAEHTFFLGKSTSSFTLPQGNPVYLELNYKCNNEFMIGIYKNTTTSSIQISPSLYIRPVDYWNKIYVELTNEVKQQTDALDFNIYFAAVKDASASNAYIFFDNIKLIHY